MDLNDVVNILTQACNSIRDALAVYARDDYYLTERNITIHVAHHLLIQNDVVIAEVNFPDDGNRHIDLVAIDIEEGSVLMLESKRWFNLDEVTPILEDVRRLRNFQLHENAIQIDNMQVNFIFKVSAIITWKENYQQWWRNQLIDYPHRCRSQRYDEIRAIFHDARKGVIDIQEGECWLLYAIFFNNWDVT